MPWTGPYVSHNWIVGDSGTAARLNNIESQYLLATTTLEQDLVAPFVLSGLVSSKDGSVLNQLDVTSGVAFLIQTDGTLARQAIASSAGPLTTSSLSTTYYLDLNPNGSYSFATSHSGTTNYITIAQVNTDGSGNITTVTDARPLGLQFFPGAAGSLTFPSLATAGAITNVGGQATAGTLGVPLIVAQALDVHVTTTTNQTILTFNVPVTGMYRANGHLSLNNGSSPQTILFGPSYTDPHLGTPIAYFSSNYAVATAPLMDGANNIVCSFVSIPTQSITIYAKGGTTISIKYQDPGGTPNDYVSAVIERLT
jgi:hypothetical protein